MKTRAKSPKTPDTAIVAADSAENASDPPFKRAMGRLLGWAVCQRWVPERTPGGHVFCCCLAQFVFAVAFKETQFSQEVERPEVDAAANMIFRLRDQQIADLLDLSLSMTILRESLRYSFQRAA